MADLEDLDTRFPYSLSEDNIKQGAEARIFECVYLGRPAILKERFAKSYRHELLDKQLNKTRLRSEVKGIVKAQQLKVDAPAVFFIDGEQNKVIMERVIGITAREWIENQRKDLEQPQFESVTREFGKKIGGCVARMHVGGLIHGDLTTSNVMLRDGEPTKPVFLDFGLSAQGKVTAEDKGVDLYVLERALISTHIDSQYIFDEILAGYAEENMKNGKVVIQKLDEIRLRGRKRDMVG